MVYVDDSAEAAIAADWSIRNDYDGVRESEQNS
jgi:hypothetical protein